MTPLPLAGRRVVITRSADQSEALAERIIAAGGEPVVVPLIEIVEPSDGGAALNEALSRLACFDWLIVTSPNGAARVTAAAAAAGRDCPRIAAVGTATASALTVPVELVPSRQIAEALADEFPHGTGRVLIAQAEAARPVLSEGLTAKGWHVETVAAYRTVSTAPAVARDPSLLLAVLSADAVLFASGSAVRAWGDAFGEATPPIVIAIGPATAEAARALGLKVTAIATDHSLDGLVRCLETNLVEGG